MLRLTLVAVAVLALPSVGRAADTRPTPAEAAEIKQLSEDIFGLATRKKACEKLGDYGPKAWAAIPNLTELLTEKKERDASVLVAAATALGKIGGAAVVKTLSGVAARHEMAEVRAAALAEVVRIEPTAAGTTRLAKQVFADTDAAVRMAAALALIDSPGGVRPPDDDLVAAVAAGLTDALAKGRLADAQARFDGLAKRVPADRKALLGQALIRACDNPPPEAVPALAALVARHAPAAPEAVALFQAAIRDMNVPAAILFALIDHPKANAQSKAVAAEHLAARLDGDRLAPEEMVLATKVLARQDQLGLPVALRLMRVEQTLKNGTGREAGELARRAVRTNARESYRLLLAEDDEAAEILRAVAAAELPPRQLLTLLVDAAQRVTSGPVAIRELARAAKTHRVAFRELLAECLPAAAPQGSEAVFRAAAAANDAEWLVLLLNAKPEEARRAALQALPTTAAALPDKVVDRFRDALTGEVEDVRTAAIGYFLHPKRVKDTPAETWLGWLKDPAAKPDLRAAAATGVARTMPAADAVVALSIRLTDAEPRVRAAAASALGSLGKSAEVALPMLKKLFDDTSPSVVDAAYTAVAKLDPRFEPHVYWKRYLPADATSVIDLRLRSVLDLLPVKKALTDKIREELKKGDLTTTFKVDVLRDVTDVAFVVSDDNKTGTVILGGRFDDAPKGQIIELNGFGTVGLGLCVSSTTLLLSNDRAHLKSLTAPDRKPPTVPDWVTKQLPVRAEKPVLWAATEGKTARFLNGLAGLNVQQDPVGLSAQLDIGPKVWTATVRVVCATDDEAREWEDRLDRLRQLAIAFLPFVAGSNPGLKEPMDDVVKALGKAKPVSKGKVASLAIDVQAATIDAFAKALAGDDK